MVQYRNNLPVIESAVQRIEAISTDKKIASGKSPRNDEFPYPKYKKQLSLEAQTVLKEGKLLWQAYFAHTDERKVRDELKLNRPDVGWYQVRKALQARNSDSDFPTVSFKPFEDAYKALS
ncbi:MAG: hypothetical protein HYX39_10015 [Bacteroidetes bacterium]|nr:hypothetical protein [Bacteroidota bacterium]